MIDIEFRNVWKKYRIRASEDGQKGSRSQVRRLLGRVFPGRQHFSAVQDVSFTVSRGEAIGIIGHNGAGKSTMLKMLARITAPTEGSITIRGRLAALLEVGSGFHPELTGRENVYLSGSILGMKRSEITAKLDQIIEFSGIRAFIDVPVKRYSSGMYVRLGFAIAAHLDPDILLLDEVLAVGDASFQKKCLQRVEEMRRSGITIVFISHDLNAVQEICTRCLLMEKGKLQADGKPADVIREYQQLGKLQPSRVIEEQRRTLGLPDCHLTGLGFYDADGINTLTFRTGEPLRLNVSFYAEERCQVIFVVHFCALDSTRLCMFREPLAGSAADVAAGYGSVEFETGNVPLQPGIYYVDAGVINEDATQSLDWHHACYTVRIEPGIVTEGEFFMPQVNRLLTTGMPEDMSHGMAVMGSVGRAPEDSPTR